jgi:hypothetical protein
MRDPPTEHESRTVSPSHLALFATGAAAGAVAGPCLRYVWPAPYAQILVFCSFSCIVFFGVEFARRKRPTRLMQIYYVANALYLAAFLPLVDGLRDSILNGAGGSRPETWAVTAMSVLIVATAYSLLLRASFTREDEREIRRVRRGHC